MKASLEQKVHALLDAGRDPVEDPEIRAAVAADDEARAEVAGLATIERWLRDWEVSVPEEDLDPIAQRIEQRLDEPITSWDATAPPEFDDPDAKVSSLGGERGAMRSGEYSLAALAGAVDTPAPATMTGPSPAVTLPAPPRLLPRRRPPLTPWLAAVAVVTLGVVVSVATLQRADESASVASLQAEREPEAVAEVAPTEPSAYPKPPEPLEMAEAAEGFAEGDLAREEEAAVAPPASARGGARAEPPAPSRRRTVRRDRMGAPMASGSPPAALDRTVSGGAMPMRSAAAERQAAVERSKAAVRACLGSGTESAVVMVRFRDGTVRDARLLRPTGNDAANECLTSALRRARVRPEGLQERRTLYYRWGVEPSSAHR